MHERLKELRKSLGLTQAEFGEKIAMRQTGVAWLESGDRKITDRVIATICAVFGVNEHWLRTGEGEMFPPKSPDDEYAELIGDLLSDEEDSFRRRLVTAICKLDDNQIEAVKEFMREIVEGKKK